MRTDLFDFPQRQIPWSAWSGRLSGIYARSVYLPATILGRSWRRVSRRLRGVRRGQETRLPVAGWREIFPAGPILLAQPAKNQGDVNLAELSVLATAAASVSVGEEIVEIGTFDGRTTLNLAINAPAHLSVFTLDLPPEAAPKFALAPGERAFVEKPRSGRHFVEAGPEWRAAAARITQGFGDSATFDWSAHVGRAGLVFVDGSHAHDYVVADTETALKLLAPQGMIVWHDYGVWEGVTRALEEIEARRHLGLRHVRGTSLVVWKSA
jgi:predicted O-methyltransferase YrrM